MWRDLKDFLMRGNVVDLAVAVIIGTAFSQVVSSLVADVITPLIGALGGVPDFSGIRLGPIALGRFLNALLNFLIVGTTVSFLVWCPCGKRKSASGSRPRKPLPRSLQRRSGFFGRSWKNLEKRPEPAPEEKRQVPQTGLQLGAAPKP